MIIINKQVIIRTKRAIKCLGFNLDFYKQVQREGLSSKNVFYMKNKYLSDKRKWIQNSNSIESDFRWLITIGVLRREVDGQGLTSKVRLTPLGRQILEESPGLVNKQPSLFERVINWITRNFLFR